MLSWRLADPVQGRRAGQGLRSLPSPHAVPEHAGPASAGRVSKQAMPLGSRFLTASDHTEETSEGARAIVTRVPGAAQGVAGLPPAVASSS